MNTTTAYRTSSLAVERREPIWKRIAFLCAFIPFICLEGFGALHYATQEAFIVLNVLLLFGGGMCSTCPLYEARWTLLAVYWPIALCVFLFFGIQRAVKSSWYWLRYGED